MLAIGSKIRHKKCRDTGKIIDMVKSVMDGKQVVLIQVKWDKSSEDTSIPMRWADEGSHGKKGYLANELEEF